SIHTHSTPRHHRHRHSFPTRRSSDLEKHGAIRQALANNLKSVVAQKLIKGLKKGRVPTNEIMIVNATIRKLIAEGQDGKILDGIDRKSTRLNSSHVKISYAVFCLKKK